MYYSDYLQLDKVLGAQDPESAKEGTLAHDEMLFIIIHQAYELWFRQILHEVESVKTIMEKPAINDNSPELQLVVHRLQRINQIMKVLIQQVDVLETMTPLDFLDFRDLLRPASGFQSIQFKILEAELGLQQDERFGKEYYRTQLREDDLEKLEKAESSRSLLALLNQWLERMPYFDEKFWDGEPSGFWTVYRQTYVDRLVPGEKGNLEQFNAVLGENDPGDRRLSNRANRAALFIMLYRGYPLLQLPYQLLNNLLDIDESMATWRYRHMNMVHRMIGNRVGTGGSTGKKYLRGAAEKHYIFSEIADLTSFLIDRGHLPELPKKLERALGFGMSA